MRDPDVLLTKHMLETLRRPSPHEAQLIHSVDPVSDFLFFHTDIVSGLFEFVIVSGRMKRDGLISYPHSRVVYYTNGFNNINGVRAQHGRVYIRKWNSIL